MWTDLALLLFSYYGPYRSSVEHLGPVWTSEGHFKGGKRRQLGGPRLGSIKEI